MNDLPFLTKRASWFNWLSAGSLLLLLGMIFLYAPTEKTMGHVQRLFYFHVGSAWVAAVTFFVALLCGVWYLRRPSPILDTIGYASVEVGIAFLTMAIVSGSVWGKPAWNAWWVWSGRLTTVTIMWLVYVAYFMLRSALDDEEKRRKFSAVYLITAFATVIISYGSIRVLRDIHPVMFGDTLESAKGLEQGLQEFSGLDSAYMGITLTVAVVVFTLLYITWVINRIKLQKISEEVQQLKISILNQL